MIPPIAVLFALLVASPTLWAAMMDETISVDAAFRRVAAILVVATLGFVAVQRLVNPFVLQAQRAAADESDAPERDDSAASRRSSDR